MRRWPCKPPWLSVRRDRRPFFRAQFAVDLGVLKDILYILYDTVSDCIIRIRYYAYIHVCMKPLGQNKCQKHQLLGRLHLLEGPPTNSIDSFRSGFRQSSKLHHSLINRCCNQRFHPLATPKNSPSVGKIQREAGNIIIRSVEKVVSKLQTRLSSYCRYLTEGLP